MALSKTTTAFSYFWGYVSKHRFSFAMILVCMFCLVVLMKLPSWFFARLIDILNESDNTLIWQNVLPILLALLLTDVGANLLRRLIAVFIQRVEPELEADIKKDSSAYILGHSLSFLVNQPAGKLSARVTQLSDRCARLFWTFVWGFYMPLVNILITLAMLLWVNWRFAALFVFFLSILGSILLITSARTKKYAADKAEKAAVSSGFVVDMVNNGALVKSFAAERREQELLEPLLRAECDAGKTMISRIETAKCYQFIVVSVFHFSMLALGVFLWQKNMISAGDIVLILLLTSNIMQIFNHFVHDLLDWYKTTGTIDNALEILKVPHQIVDSPKAPALKVTHGDICFDKVRFGYAPGKEVFKNFSLHIRAGEKVGLVGISGSGKTTFINLLQRFYDIAGGRILIDGQDIRFVTQTSLRRSIAVIPQETALFHRSLAENIAYGNPAASPQAIRRAARQAFAHDFIEQTEHGYETLVGERGIKLSGGQRQRIAIARALLKKAPILILDEATSALDSESEGYIQESLKKLMRGKTVIAIAHRLSTLKEMDRIVVMSKGKVVEEGSIDTLLRRNGRFAKLWRLQTRFATSARDLF